MGNMHCPAQDAAHLAAVARDFCPFPNYSLTPLFVSMLSVNSSLHLSEHYATVQASLTTQEQQAFTQTLRSTFGPEGKVTYGGVGVVALSLAVFFDTVAREVKGEYESYQEPIPGLFIKDPRGYYAPEVYTVSKYLRLVPHIANNPSRMRDETKRDDFDPVLLQPGFEPPHYELCTLRRTTSGDLTDGALAEDFQKIRRSSSKCIRDHHCGSHQGSVHGSVHGSRSNLSMRDGIIASDGGTGQLPPTMMSQQSPLLSHHTTPTGRRNILVMKHSYSQDGADGYRGEEEDMLMMDHEPTTSSQLHMQHQQIHSNMVGLDHGVHRTLSNDF